MQLDRVSTRKKSRPVRREAEIDLEQDLGSESPGKRTPNPAAPIHYHKRKPIPRASRVQTHTAQKWGKQPKLEAYIGAELYPHRMYPTGCPSFQKVSIKLFKVEAVEQHKGKGEKQKLRLVDSQFKSNRDGFGFMLKNLTAGQYQL